jgi:hypothetical protein
MRFRWDQFRYDVKYWLKEIAIFGGICIGSLIGFITFIGVAGALFLDERNETVVEKTFNNVQITKVYPPKHVYFDLIDSTTNTTHTKVYVSKHCNNYRNIPLNTNTIVVVEKIHVFEDKKFKQEIIKYKLSHLCN